MDSINDISRATTFLSSLSEGARAELFAVGTRRRFPAGSTIFVEGDVAHEALVLLDGRVKALVMASDGKEVILDVLGAGALLGEVASIDGGARSATAQTLGAVEVLTIRINTFSEFLLSHPPVLHHLANVLARRLRASDRRQLELGTGDSLGRLCIRILELANRYGEPNDDGHIRVESPLSQADLAAWSGLSREAIVKSMRKLRELGWIENRGKSITLLEPEKIRSRAEH